MPEPTQELSLRKPIASDPFAIEDFRFNYDAIDLAIKQLRSQVTTLQAASSGSGSSSGTALTLQQADARYQALGAIPPGVLTQSMADGRYAPLGSGGGGNVTVVGLDLATADARYAPIGSVGGGSSNPGSRVWGGYGETVLTEGGGNVTLGHNLGVTPTWAVLNLEIPDAGTTDYPLTAVIDKDTMNSGSIRARIFDLNMSGNVDAGKLVPGTTGKHFNYFLVVGT